MAGKVWNWSLVKDVKADLKTKKAIQIPRSHIRGAMDKFVYLAEQQGVKITFPRKSDADYVIAKSI